MRTIILSALLAVSSVAHADDWTGPDKKKHFAVGAAIGAAGTVAFGQRGGFALGVAAGAAKELYDLRHRDRHDVSGKDFAVTAVGALAGSALPGLVLGPHYVGMVVDF